jgi:hypothetical protein
MSISFERIKYRYRIFKEKNFTISYILSLVFLVIGSYIGYYATLYATERMSSPVTDIILSNIRAYDVGSIFLYGPIVFWTFIVALLVLHPNKVPLTLKSIALFIVVRAIFVSMTHIGAFWTNTPVDPTSVISSFFSIYGGDLFFSGHTGLPFLFALIFWDSKPWRYSMILCSIFFGAIVLLGHFHYTIDVFSAFFITYGIYNIAIRIFVKDKEYFGRG